MSHNNNNNIGENIGDAIFAATEQAFRSLPDGKPASAVIGVKGAGLGVLVGGGKVLKAAIDDDPLTSPLAETQLAAGGMVGSYAGAKAGAFFGAQLPAPPPVRAVAAIVGAGVGAYYGNFSDSAFYFFRNFSDSAFYYWKA
jgi:phage tail tape-measure protein